MSNPHVVADPLQELGHPDRRVGAVVDDEDPDKSGRHLRGGLLRASGRGIVLPTAGSLDDEPASEGRVQPLVAMTVPPCISTSDRTSVRPIPSPPPPNGRATDPLGRRDRTSARASRGECRAHHPDPDDDLFAFDPARRAEDVRPPDGSVLGGVGQQVHNNLLETHRVGIKSKVGGREREH